MAGRDRPCNEQRRASPPRAGVRPSVPLPDGRARPPSAPAAAQIHGWKFSGTDAPHGSTHGSGTAGTPTTRRHQPSPKPAPTPKRAPSPVKPHLTALLSAPAFSPQSISKPPAPRPGANRSGAAIAHPRGRCRHRGDTCAARDRGGARRTDGAAPAALGLGPDSEPRLRFPGKRTFARGSSPPASRERLPGILKQARKADLATLSINKNLEA